VVLCVVVVGAGVVDGAVIAGSPVLGGWGVRVVFQAVRRRFQPVLMRWFQGQSRGSRSRRLRPVRMMRPATVSRRKRKRLGSHLRAGWCSSKARVCVQVMDSVGSLTS